MNFAAKSTREKEVAKGNNDHIMTNYLSEKRMAQPKTLRTSGDYNNQNYITYK